MKNSVDMKRFMSRHDLVFNEIPHIWYEAPFLANGFFGCTAWFADGDEKLVLALGHTCVFDNRELDGRDDDTLIKIPRLPIGNIGISFAARVEKVEMRLDIYDAVLNGKAVTSKGESTFSLKFLEGTDCLIFDHNETGEEKLSFEYIPSHGESPRVAALRKTGENAFADYAPARKSRYEHTELCDTFVQPYFNGGAFALSFKNEGGSYFASLGYDDADEFSAPVKSAKIIENAVRNRADLEAEHKRINNSFFDKSFLSWDDGLYEDFYYIQLYKLHCASRENGMVFDTCGPWLSDTTRWPAAWWNLNVELTVSPLYTSNHIDVARCVSNTLANHIDDLINNVPEKYRADCAALGRSTERGLYAPVVEPGDLAHPNYVREAGNLLWGLFCCYTEYKMTGNRTLVENTIFPLLKRAVKYYGYFLYEGADGRLHLKATLSPEYIKSDSDDVNYDLGLLRWGLLKLLELNEEFGFGDESETEWRNTLDSLCDYAQREGEGLMIAADTPYAESHRHYSHILAFYPLHVLDRDNEKDRKLVETTIDFWQSKPEALLGYSQTGAASMRAMLRDGNKALAHLDRLMNGFIRPNTMYHEDGNPVLETPPSAATAILEMFIQSHDGYIEFFPAVPDKWQNVCFDRLLCEGCFEAGAELENGKLKWLTVTSLRGGDCRFKADFCGGKPEFGKPVKEENGIYSVYLEKGETLTVTLSDDCCVHAVRRDAKNHFGKISGGAARE